MKRLSIKWRVTIWYTGFFAVLVVAVVAFVYQSSLRTTTAFIQQNLMYAVMDAADEIEYDDGLDVDKDVEEFDDVSILVYDREGKLYYGHRPDGFAAPISPGQLQTVQDGEHQWYAYDLQMGISGYGDVVVRGLVSATAAQFAETSIIDQALRVFPWVLLIAGAGGYLLTRQAFLPVKRITDTANSISGGGDLSKRLGITGTKDEISTLAETFDHMFARLETAFRHEQRFTSDASHELRTPASVIVAQCEYALSQAATDRDREMALQTILEQAQDMSALIAQLLALARMDAGRQQMEWEMVDVSLLLESVVDALEEEAENKSIALHLDVPPSLTLYGDQTLLTRMLMNLVENAVKYGRQDGDVWVAAKQGNGQLICTIRDNGIGISAGDMENIWERFYRVDQARHPQGSFGLGLPMARWIAQAHGGVVEVQSEPGKGSVFTVNFPCSLDGGGQPAYNLNQ